MIHSDEVTGDKQNFKRHGGRLRACMDALTAFLRFTVTSSLIASFVLLLTACHINPPPTLVPPDTFPSAPSGLSHTQNLPELAWWKQFNDPTLDTLIQTGLKNNNDLHIAEANLEQAQGQLKQVQLSWLPFANLMGGFSQNPVLGSPGGFYGVFANYAVNLMQLPAQQKQAGYEVTLQKAQVSAVRLTLIGQLSASYLTYLGQREQLHLLDVLEKDITAQKEIQQAALSGNITTAIDVDLLQSQLQKVIAEKKVVEGNIVRSGNALHFLLNENPGKFETGTLFSQLTAKLNWPFNLPATVLANRPDLWVAEARLKMAREEITISGANLFPTIQIDRFTGAGSPNSSTMAPQNYMNMSEAYLNWQMTPSVFGQIEASKGAYKAATYNYIQTVRAILRDVDTDFALARAFQEKLAAYTQAFKALNEELQLQQNLYDTGLAPYSQVLQSKVRVDDMALLLNQTKLDALIFQVVLYQDLAGGYQSQGA